MALDTVTLLVFQYSIESLRMMAIYICSIWYNAGINKLIKQINKIPREHFMICDFILKPL